jgi:hypothetical protein
MMESIQSLAQDPDFLSIVLNAVILIFVMFLSKKSLERIRKIIDILSNESSRNVPQYFEQRSMGRRKYDLNHLREENPQKGGDV